MSVTECRLYKNFKKPLLLFLICCGRARRAAKEAKDAPAQPALLEKAKVDIRKFVKIGRPGYKG